MELSGADNAWLLASSALVMFMTPGLALFYGGLVRAKNVLGTIMQSFFALGLVSVLWMIVGYSLGFGPDNGKFIGDFSFFGLKDVSASEAGPFAATIPHMTYMIFQMMFAVITPALITGAFAERMKFRGYVLYMGLWSILCYSPVAHWVWGGGWLGLGEGNVQALDFAGGTVVHINAGVAALATILYMGKRKGYGKQAMHPHNIPMVITGAEEAALAFAGAAGAVDVAQPTMVLDVGGGSTELIAGDGDGAVAGEVSLQLGCVRLTERHLHDDPPAPNQIVDARAFIAAEMDRADHALREAGVRVDGLRSLIGVAGTATTLAALHLDLPAYQEERIHGTRGLDGDPLLMLPAIERAIAGRALCSVSFTKTWGTSRGSSTS